MSRLRHRATVWAFLLAWRVLRLLPEGLATVSSRGVPVRITVFTALVVMLCWGVQAYFMKAANALMSAESIFFYMMVTGLLLTPVAWAMTDTARPINWGWDGPGLAAALEGLDLVVVVRCVGL